MGYPLEKSDKSAKKTREGRFVPKYYNEICGSANAGSLLAQMRYWWKIKGEKEFPKSLARFATEIEISYGKARNAEDVLIEHGFIKIDVRQAGYAPKLKHWTFCEEEVERAINNFKNDRSIRAIKNIIPSPEQTDCSQELTVSSPEQTDCSPQLTHKDIVLDIILDSSSSPTPSGGQPVAAQEEKKEEEFSIRTYYATDKKAVPEPRPADMKSISAGMLDVWNRLCPNAKVTDSSHDFALLSRFQDCFGKSYDEWKKYCLKIASSKFLMGERAMSNRNFYKLSLIWALSPANIENIKNGKYDCDREVPKAKEDVIVEQESVIDAICNSNEEPWVIKLRKELLDKFGAPTYKSWFNDLKINEKNGIIFLVAPTPFRRDHIEQNFGEDIRKAVASAGIANDFQILDSSAYMAIKPSNEISPQALDDDGCRKLDVQKAIASFVDSLRLPQKANERFANSA